MSVRAIIVAFNNKYFFAAALTVIGTDTRQLRSTYAFLPLLQALNRINIGCRTLYDEYWR